MSGGRFDYKQYDLQHIAEDINQVIHEFERGDKSEWGDYPKWNFENATLPIKLSPQVFKIGSATTNSESVAEVMIIPLSLHRLGGRKEGKDDGNSNATSERGMTQAPVQVLLRECLLRDFDRPEQVWLVVCGVFVDAVLSFVL